MVKRRARSFAIGRNRDRSESWRVVSSSGVPSVFVVVARGARGQGARASRAIASRLRRTTRPHRPLWQGGLPAASPSASGPLVDTRLHVVRRLPRLVALDPSERTPQRVDDHRPLRRLVHARELRRWRRRGAAPGSDQVVVAVSPTGAVTRARRHERSERSKRRHRDAHPLPRFHPTPLSSSTPSPPSSSPSSPSASSRAPSRFPSRARETPREMTPDGR